MHPTRYHPNQNPSLILPRQVKDPALCAEGAGKFSKQTPVPCNICCQAQPVFGRQTSMRLQHPQLNCADGLQPPDFYDSTPPAPPGLIWWQYKAGVPPLPPPTDVNPTWVRYGWKYDPDWHPLSYTPNNMDQASFFCHVPSSLLVSCFPDLAFPLTSTGM